jgi:phosphatidate cytidylyltransferase
LPGAKRLGSFIQRTVTGAIYVAAIIGSVFIGSFAFFLLIFLANILSLKEFMTMIKKMFPDFGLSYRLIITGSFIYLIGATAALGLIPQKMMIVALIIPLLLISIELFLKKEKPLINLSLSIFGIVYITIPFVMLIFLAANPYDQNTGAPLLLLSFFVIIWVNDTFAYLTGKIIGRHLIFKRISPKKTWEGTVGGFVFSMAAGYIFYQTSDTLPLWQWLSLAGVIVISGIFGDFAESMIKRSLNIKDSGNALPGHGGFLDRFDSLLFAAPAATIFLYLVN